MRGASTYADIRDAQGRDGRRIGDQQAAFRSALRVVVDHQIAGDIPLRGTHPRERAEYDTVIEFERADMGAAEELVHSLIPRVSVEDERIIAVSAAAQSRLPAITVIPHGHVGAAGASARAEGHLLDFRAFDSSAMGKRDTLMDRMAAMETFVTVVEAGSFSAAARRLKLGQPAVSKSIAQLEAHLAARLLLRSTRGLAPTDAGQRFYEHARRAIAEAEQAEQSVRESSEGLSGKLRISAAVTFARLHVLPALKAFLDQHPRLEIDIMLDDRSIDLLEEGVDVALRMGVLDDSAMTARRILRGRRFVIGTTEYFAQAGIPETPADLSRHQAIVYSLRGGGESWSFSRSDGTQTSVAVSGRVRVSAAEGMRTAVLGHMGLAVASEWMFSPELKDGTVKAVLTDWMLPPIDVWAVFPSGRMATTKARAFVAFVEQLFADKGGPAAALTDAGPAA
jgi:DNA-binding transcriptional LysR family regulator